MKNLGLKVVAWLIYFLVFVCLLTLERSMYFQNIPVGWLWPLVQSLQNLTIISQIKWASAQGMKKCHLRVSCLVARS